MAEENQNQNQEQDKQQEDKKTSTNLRNMKPKFNAYWIYGLIALVFIGIQFLDLGQEPEKIDIRTFINDMLKKHDVEKIVVINDKRAEIYIKESKLDLERYKHLFEEGFSPIPKSGPHYYFNIGTVETFVEELKNAQKDFIADQKLSIEYEERKDYFGEILSWLLPIIILVAVWLFIFRRMGAAGGGAGNIFNIGKSKAKIFDKEGTHIKINFNDVAGLEEAKVEIMEIVDFLKNPQKYTQLGGKIPKGALLVGPPGTGKTLLAKAVAGEADVPFFSMSGSDFVEMFVGVGASRVRDLFSQAKEKAPCIIFIDEIDAIGRARGKNPNMGANDERENTLNQLLTEMDGFDTNTGVIILAATNRADILDRALLRAGRFDRQIHVELPDLNERNEIFKVHLRPIKVDENLSTDFLAKQTPGFSGADIANVCNEAALIAARRDRKKVGRQDFLDAVDRIIGGLEKKNKIITQDEKKTIAYHEAGHATVSWLLEYANPLIKVTIVPRGQALGAAWYLPEERHITTKEQIIDEMCSTLGGRASEEINFGKISTGALNDLEKVTKQAYAVVSFFGMSSEVGNLSYYDSTGQSEFSFNRPYSEKTAEVIDIEVKKLVDECYHRAKHVLLQNKDGLIKLSKLLLEREVIFTEDVETIFGKREFNERNEFIGKPLPESKASKPEEEMAQVEEKPADNEDSSEKEKS